MTTDVPTRSAVDMVSHGPFSRLWWSSVCASTGDWITVFASIALGGTIAGETGVVIALISRILPGLLLGAAVGVISDRVDRRRLVFIADLGRGLVVPLLVFATSLPLLVAINVAMELFSLTGQPPRNAMLPRLVRRENLVTANSLILGATYGTVPLGAGLNWILVSLPALSINGLIPSETDQLALSFIVAAVAFLASASLIALLPVIRSKLAEQPTDDEVGGSGGRALSELVEGVKFFWHHKTVRRVIVGMMVALIGGGTMVVLGRSFVENVLDADQAGFFAIITTMGTGAGLGIGVVSLYEERLPQRDLVFAVALIGAGIGLSAASLTHTVVGAGLWMFVMGFGAGSAYVMGLTHLHEEVEDELRGRVFATLFLMIRVGLFVSMAVAPSLVVILNSASLSRWTDARRVVLFAGGVIIVVSAVVMLWGLRSRFRGPHIGEESRDVMMRLSKAHRAALRRRRADEENDQ